MDGASFGLANVHSHFRPVMNSQLVSNSRLCKFDAIYVDNILIRSSMREEHLDQVWFVLDHLNIAGVKQKR